MDPGSQGITPSKLRGCRIKFLVNFGDGFGSHSGVVFIFSTTNEGGKMNIGP